LATKKEILLAIIYLSTGWGSQHRNGISSDTLKRVDQTVFPHGFVWFERFAVKNKLSKSDRTSYTTYCK
jgi:hypothetical protein